MAKFPSAVRFKCMHTGNIAEFTAEHDIEVMRKHNEYTEVREEPVEAAPVVKTRKQVTPTEE